MQVTIKVYDVIPGFMDGNYIVSPRDELRFTLILPVSSDTEASDLATFAEAGFSLAHTQHPSDWYAGLRMAYLGLKSAYHFDGQGIRIDANID